MDRHRLVLCILSLVVLQAGYAQQGYHTYRFSVPPMPRTYDQKNLYGALHELDQEGTYVLDPVNGEVRMTLLTAVDSLLLSKYLAYYGFRLSRLMEWNAATDSMQPVPAIDPDAYPYYRDTGDRVRDNALYEQAKEQWIANHPEGNKQRVVPNTGTE